MILGPGSYWLKISNDYCDETDTIHIEQYIITKPFLLNDTVLCVGDTVSLFPLWDASNYLLKWDNSDSTLNRKIYNEGTYWLTIYNEYCSETDSVSISFKRLPQIDFPSDTTLCIGDTLFISISESQVDYFYWNPDLGNTDNQITHPGEYMLLTENICGDTTYLVVVDFKNCECNPLVPNSFSPNNDGRNDSFIPYYCENDFMKLEIFDRWGNKLFQTMSEEEGWDGIYNGKPVPIGTYLWVITTTLKGDTKVLSGTVQVLR